MKGKKAIDKGCVKGLLKGTSSDVVNIPHKLIKELGWKIHEPIEIRISDCSMMKKKEEDWQEITIMRLKDAERVYEDEEL